MKSLQQSGFSPGLTTSKGDRKAKKKMACTSIPRCSVESHNIKLKDERGVATTNMLKNSYLIDHPKFLSSPVTVFRRRVIPVVNSQSCSGYDVGPYDADERFAQKNGIKEAIYNLFRSPFHGLQSGSVTCELVFLALPAVLGQAVDPLAQLMETSYVGRLGPLELASAGVSVSIFNIISKIFNVPLLSITTSFVAEDISRNSRAGFISDGAPQDEKFDVKEISTEQSGRMRLPSVSTALFLATGIGTVEALALFLGSGLFLNMMGVSAGSPMRFLAQQFLCLRALGAPAQVVSLAVQGVFRGFKDTHTPLFCIGLGNLSAVFLLPFLVYSFRFGMIGAAIATVASQYITAFLLIWFLSKRAVLLAPKIEDLQFGGYLKSGGLLLGRTLSILVTMTLGTSMAARQGPMAMAAHQICYQVWLAVSLLSDALAVSAQALIANSFAKSDYKRVKEVTSYVLKAGLVAGICLAIVMGAFFGNIAELFTKDVEVLQIIKTIVLFVTASQPINTLAFIFDGLHYGVSDFSYVAYSTMVVGAISSAFLLYAPSLFGLLGVWYGLTLLMTLRMAAGFMRLWWKTGPWWFLWKDSQMPEIAD